MSSSHSPARMLDDALRDRAISNVALAKALDVRPNVISMWRTGDLAIPATRALAVARTAGIDPFRFVRACIAGYPDSGPWQAFAAGLSLAERT